MQAINTGAAVTERSGATAGTDTVPAGCTLLLRNTGAGTHVVTLKCNQSVDSGLTTSDRAISLPTGAPGIQAVFVPWQYADTNGRVGIGVDAAPTEVKYYVLSGT